MRVCVAQSKPIKEDIVANIEQHKKLIHLAIYSKADVIVFPELSITGYEPTLARGLAMDASDTRLDSLQQIADLHAIIIGAGIPMKCRNGINITMVLFHPNAQRQTYSKQYLHADEKPFFVSGENNATCIRGSNVELAICYEISVPEHSANAGKNGGKIYLASVAKSAKGVKAAHQTLSGIAAKYGMTVLMANSVGPSDDFVGAGGSAVWNSDGILLEKMDSESEGFLILDIETQETFKVV
ncbi:MULTISPECIES: carbon-nitrogen hydrolase family protein [unclassified Imperialibacter]|uniref:carbon-nitrogen hydrolase family protein n=1 Tax=unclassified Imperialibacter TaxID=2629706 RepID=UPI0012587655|nr:MULTISPECIES: carbon-nitrogen hydrolase family protein [unclassified Imperialibacter]CAD5255626.1 putative amidohydrolase [Imperialibacter sp. 89]CAD5261715.1 putative amidohydrolase [Imperialibacter sp. 75]VVT32825.1 Predicted amidohydrolase [Imperialibacter sp. EC-SDR9]